MVYEKLWIHQEVGTEIMWMDMPTTMITTSQECMDAYMQARTGVYSSNQPQVEITCGKQSSVSVDKLYDVT